MTETDGWIPDAPSQVDRFVAYSKSGTFPPWVQTWQLIRARARGISQAPAKLLASEGFDYWTDIWMRRCDEHLDAFIILGGKVGVGKSTLGLEIAIKCDPTFLPNIATRLVYSPEALISALEHIQPKQVIIYDEAIQGLANVDSGFQKETKLLLKAFAMSRFKSCITILIAPSIHQIHLQVRGSRATHWVECLSRGIAIVHEKYDGIQYRKNSELVGYSRSDLAPYLLWAKIPETSAIWRSYESNKEANFNAFLQEAKEQLHKKGSGGKTSTARVRKWRREHSRK